MPSEIPHLACVSPVRTKDGMIRAEKVSSLTPFVRKYRPPLKLAGYVMVEGLGLGIPESIRGV